MFTVKRVIRLTVGLVLTVSVVVLSGCSSPPNGHVINATPLTGTDLLARPTPTASSTSEPTATSTASSTATTAPAPTTHPTATATVTVTKTAPPTTPPKTVAPLKYPPITRGTLAWSRSAVSCLFKWSGTAWKAQNFCRTPTGNGLRDYFYKDRSGKLLFTAASDPDLGFIWWSDALLEYQQITNFKSNSFAKDPYGYHTADWDGHTILSLPDFFADETAAAEFKRQHPNADLSPDTEADRWIVFNNSWSKPILARACKTTEHCP